jgi:glycerol kinase
MILAIDQGTTSTRALIVEADGHARQVLSLPHSQSYPQAGWVEHDGAELLANIRACIAAAEGEKVAAIGIANQGESCLGWDADTGVPVGPVIVWQDDRTRDVIATLPEGAAALVLERAGLPLDPYFSGAKLAWILRNNATARALAKKGRLRLGTTDAFFRDHLTGRFETDITTASRTSLMNLGTGGWDDELCALFGVPQNCLPAITATTGDLGHIRDLPLTASVVDQQAALHGHGCRAPGDAKITFGTGAFALVLTGPLMRAQNGPLPTVAWARRGEDAVFALDGGVYAASSAVNWARGLGLFSGWDAINSFDNGPAIARGLAFVPALAGLACPHWDRAARGAWLGLTLDTTPRDMSQAVLEGVAFRMAEVIAAMEAVQPLNAPIRIDGGMSANPWFCQFLADVLARPILVSDEAELTAVGTASLAAHGAGLPFDLTPRGRVLHPRPIDPAWPARFAAARAAIQGYGHSGGA